MCRITWIRRVIEVSDTFDHRLTVVTIAKSDRATIIHPLCWLTENPLFMDLSSAVGQESSPKVFRDTFGQADGQAVIEGDVFIGEGTLIEAGALVHGPVWIGRNCRIGHGATLRSNVIIGDGCVVGHAAELKNAVLFNGCDVPHFNYVGDSVLGYRVHLGAGVMLSPYRLIRGPVNVHLASGQVDSGLAKFGALIGDRTEIGCNSVLNPGSIIGRDCVLYPNVTFTGVLPAKRLVKNRTELVVVEKRETLE